MSRFGRDAFVTRVNDAVTHLGLVRSPFSFERDVTLLCRNDEGLFLALALEFSRKRRGAVTASWFVGATALWAYRPRDVSHAAYLRMPTLLSMDERERLCGHEDSVAEGVSDFWWIGTTPQHADVIAECVTLTEPRFQTGVPVHDIRRSRFWRSRARLVDAVVRSVPAPTDLEELRRLGLPTAWSDAADHVLRSEVDAEPSVPTDALAMDAALCAALGISAGHVGAST